MNKRKKSPLKLNKTTVKALSGSELQPVRGGLGNFIPWSAEETDNCWCSAMTYCHWCDDGGGIASFMAC